MRELLPVNFHPADPSARPDFQTTAGGCLALEGNKLAVSLLKTRFVCRIDPLTAGVCALQPTTRGNGVIFRGAGLVRIMAAVLGREI